MGEEVHARTQLDPEAISEEKPFKGVRLAACLHVTTETAALMQALEAGGAKVGVCASNPLSTQDDVAASLVKNDGIAVFAIKGENRRRTTGTSFGPRPGADITMDDGADIVSTVHSERKELPQGDRRGNGGDDDRGDPLELHGGKGGPEIPHHRGERGQDQALLRQPVRNRADQSTGSPGNEPADGRQLFCRGRLRLVRPGSGDAGPGMGAHVVVTEMDPLPALEAVMDGFQVSPWPRPRRSAIFLHRHGNLHVIRKEHFVRMKDGAIVSNSGHFNVEIDIPALEKIAKSGEGQTVCRGVRLRNGAGSTSWAKAG